MSGKDGSTIYYFEVFFMENNGTGTIAYNVSKHAMEELIRALIHGGYNGDIAGKYMLLLM